MSDQLLFGGCMFVIAKVAGSVAAARYRIGMVVMYVVSFGQRGCCHVCFWIAEEIVPHGTKQRQETISRVSDETKGPSGPFLCGIIKKIRLEARKNG